MGKTPAPAPDAGSQRAAEVSEAMLGVPGYADDSMLFTARYVDKCKTSLCKTDFNLVRANLVAIRQIESLEEAATDENHDAAAARAAKKTELRAQTMEKIGEYPELVRDLDRFLAATRAVSKAFRGR